MNSNFGDVLLGIFAVVGFVIYLYTFWAYLNDAARIESNDVTFHFSNLKMVLIALPCAAYAAIFTLLAKSVANAEFDLSLPYLLLVHAVVLYGLAVVSLMFIGRVDKEAYFLALWITCQFGFIFAFCVFATFVVASGLADLRKGE